MVSGDWIGAVPIRAEEIHLWRASLGGKTSPAWGDREWLSAAERGRAESFRFDRDRRRFEARAVLVRAVLAGYTGCPPGELEFGAGARGKPFLVGEPGQVTFNLSHSEEEVWLAVGQAREIGVDVQNMRHLRDLDAMAERVFCDREREQYRSLPVPERRTAFYRGWTRKEAALKLLGDGLYREPRSFFVGLEAQSDRFVPQEEPLLAQAEFLDLSAPEGFAAALASTPGWRLEFRSFQELAQER